MKILIWGTGNTAQEVLENGINGEIIGFIQTIKTSEEYYGYPVYDIFFMPKEYDLIIVASIYSDEIYAECINLKLDISKILFLKHGACVSFNPDKNIRKILGEKNYTNYAGSFGVWKNTFVEEDMITYSKMNKRPEFEIREEFLSPIVSDRYAINSGMTNYFWQDLWAAKHIIANEVKEHYDIGSRVDGFIAHLLAANIKVNMIDVRPFRGEVENLFTIVDDATMLKQFEDDSIASLSALCSLEHFGLGRYGDPVDPEACFKCFSQIQRKMSTGGRLYISVPVGMERVAFNNCRIFNPNTIVSSFNKLKLIEYSVIVNNAIEYDVDLHKEFDSCNTPRDIGVGLFYFEK